jgi:hypothetical protein
MKRIAVIFLSSIIIIVNAHFGLQLALYQIFKPSIIENYCINKDVKGSTCEARCYMKKNLQQESKQDNTSSGHEIQFRLVEIFSPSSVPEVSKSPIKELFLQDAVAHYQFSSIEFNSRPQYMPPQV